MRENEFRHRLRDALGEPPPLVPPRLGPPTTEARPIYPRAMAALAIALAIVLVAVLLASRIALRPQGVLIPGVKPSPVAKAALDSFPCSLAVVQSNQASNRGQNPVMSTTLGFVNLPSGEFRVDPKASSLNLPGGNPVGPNFYSAQLNQWLPVSVRNISPDGRTYAFTKLLPEGATYSNSTSSELRVFNVEKRADHKLWSYAANMGVLGWDAAGILVSTLPARGGEMLLWRIDPATGAATEAPLDADPTWTPRYLVPNGGSSSSLGLDGHGRAVYRLGSRDPGTKYSVVVVESGHATTLYSGTVGDSKHFDPQGVSGDAHGLWLGDFDPSRLWLWTESSGLREFKITNVPPAPAGYQYTYTAFGPAGPCVPGVFTGVAPTRLPPAPTPTPSPPPPVIDWSTLTSKPLTLDQLPTGAPCPVSSRVDLAVKASYSKWPNYGFGDGPAYISGQFIWYTSGQQGAVILVDPKYKGPVLVRSKRLNGTGTLTFSGEGATALGDGSIGLAQTSNPPYWGTWAGSVIADTPGCYGIQFDGTNFSGTAVISVTKGPPPPG